MTIDEINAFAHQTMTEMMKRLYEDGQRLHPTNPAAYALSVIAACLAQTITFLGKTSDMNELMVLQRIYEDLINKSDDLASIQRKTYE